MKHGILPLGDILILLIIYFLSSCSKEPVAYEERFKDVITIHFPPGHPDTEAERISTAVDKYLRDKEMGFFAGVMTSNHSSADQPLPASEETASAPSQPTGTTLTEPAIGDATGNTPGPNAVPSPPAPSQPSTQATSPAPGPRVWDIIEINLITLRTDFARVNEEALIQLFITDGLLPPDANVEYEMATMP